MKIMLAGRYVTFSSETDGERSDLELIAGNISGQQLRVDSVNGETLALRITGPAKGDGAKGGGKDANKPLNVTFDDAPMPFRLIANLAHTPFELDGRRYASIEGFWQGIKFSEEADRQRLAAMHGHPAKDAAPRVEPGDRIVYEGREIVVGTVGHWALMEAACRAKFDQHEGARAALMATGQRPLIHRVAKDSVTIPGIVMADIWTRIRADLSIDMD